MNNTIRTAILLIASFGIIVFYIISQGVSLSQSQQSALMVLLEIYIIASVYCIISSELTKNYSQVDRLWSTIPIIYAWLMAYYGDFNPRVLMCALLISVWGIRLSINFALKGGFSWLPWKGEEDYRWMVLRSEPPFNNKFVWVIFNIFFISFYQMGLILYFTLPVLLTIDASNTALGVLDFIAFGLFIIFLLTETIADYQQYKFQNVKHQLINEKQELIQPYKSGFIKSGLWKHVRHPNYMAEQMMWFCIYLIGVAASGQWINWTLGGFILLVLLFKGSSDFSEKISKSKYPEYADYINSTGRFFPKIFTS